LPADLAQGDPREHSQAALARFGRIDVPVNNAGNFFAGFFEELTPEQFDQQMATNLGGPLNVTRLVLPLMRKQRSGHIITLSSTAGIVGQEFCSAYAASKFGLEGWMESLRFEVEPFGINTTIVEPGFFRTELLTKESTAYADLSIDDYAESTAQTRPAWEAMSGKQTNDPAHLAEALVMLADEQPPPLRWVAGADAVATVEQRQMRYSRRSMPTEICPRRQRWTRPSRMEAHKKNRGILLSGDIPEHWRSQRRSAGRRIALRSRVS
jgi:NAD(P)-dependent dehydrogenase (short-subunit alcohol dehydrogenase family)